MKRWDINFSINVVIIEVYKWMSYFMLIRYGSFNYNVNNVV